MSNPKEGTTLRIAGIVKESITDGPGLRYTLFLQGCPHHCKGCHNEATWDYEGGEDVFIETILKDIHCNPLIKGVTISGGEPIEQWQSLLPLLTKLKAMGMEVAIYTGYTFEALLDLGIEALLQVTDVLIDGPFIEEEKTLMVPFKGSMNQRILHMEESLKQRKAIAMNDGRWNPIL